VIAILRPPSWGSERPRPWWRPSGLAVRFVVDYTEYADEGVGVGAVYLLSDGVALLVLSCVAPRPPEGDWWLSIAETFEFLPAEE
jgi:hypothetical protein